MNNIQPVPIRAPPRLLDSKGDTREPAGTAEVIGTLIAGYSGVSGISAQKRYTRVLLALVSGMLVIRGRYGTYSTMLHDLESLWRAAVGNSYNPGAIWLADEQLGDLERWLILIVIRERLAVLREDMFSQQILHFSDEMDTDTTDFRG